MNQTIFIGLAVLLLGWLVCSPPDRNGFAMGPATSDWPVSTTDFSNFGSPDQTTIPASKRVDLENKGIGPVKEVKLTEEIDRKLAVKGKGIYDTKCIACHHVDQKLIGPPQKGIMSRRTPEWVMNMIMNPTEMLEKDPLAKDLLKEFNNMPMLDQSITQEEARALVEYFRTL